MKILECPPLEGKRIEHIYESIDKWLRSPALSALVKSFGSQMPAHLNTADLGAWLLDFSEQWDFRKLQQGAGGARWLVNKSSFTEERYDDVENLNRSWVIRTYDKIGNLPPLLSLSAPSSRPYPLPANSADTYNFFFEHIQVPPGSSFLLITSQIYVPYQQLEAIRTIALKHNVVVETVGFPLEWSGKLQGMLGASNYLQEIRSTIQSANRFFSAFPNE